MDERLRLVYREEFHLDDTTPHSVRTRLASFEPLLGNATTAIQLAASEVSTAFARERQPDSSMELRLFGVDHVFRVELFDSLSEDQLLSMEKGGERFIRRQVLDETTDRWGVLGNGAAIVWFEVGQSVETLEELIE